MNLLPFDNIRILGTREEPWFVAKDVAELLGYKDPDKAIRNHVVAMDKQTFKIFKSSLSSGINIHGSLLLISKQGVICLIQRSRLIITEQVEEFLKFLQREFEISCNIFKILYKEQETIRNIIICFQDLPYKLQYPVDNYRIDLYFTKHKLAIECDEFGHSDRDPTLEKEREVHITNKLGCLFYRYNPDSTLFNIFQIINDIRKLLYRSAG